MVEGWIWKLELGVVSKRKKKKRRRCLLKPRDWRRLSGKREEGAQLDRGRKVERVDFGDLGARRRRVIWRERKKGL